MTLLNSQKSQLVESINQEITILKQQIQLAQPSSQSVQLDQTLAGRVSRIDAIQQQKMAESALVRDSKRLDQLERSLQAISLESFGTCVECDEAIPFKRLLVKPESELCVGCQELQE